MDAAFALLLARVVSTYRHTLADSPPAREWLTRRGVSDAGLLDRFRVGLSDGSLPSLARGEVLDHLKLLGLLDAEGRERFAGSIVIPCLDDQGSVVQLAAYDPDGRLSWLFPDETPCLWNGSCLRHARDVLLVADPLSGLAAGTDAVIAPAGPGTPLGQGAKDQLLAHRPRLTLKGCDRLRPELERLGIDLAGRHKSGADRIVEEDPNGFTVEFARRLRFAVQGLSQDSPRHLRASVKCFRHESHRPRIHLDTLDLFHARSRIAFAKTAACLLGEDPAVMEEHLTKIVSLAEDFLRERHKPIPQVIVTPADEAGAMELLRDPNLLDRVARDLTTLGYVGEETNKIAAFVVSLSRRLEDPLSLLVLSRSAAGKSSLAEAIAALCPPEDLLRFTRLTAQTLYYQKPDALAHKMVLIEEETGAEDAAYALRVLQSARRLSLSTAAGRGDARTREVRGPVSLFVTTTRTDLDEETAGRFLTLSVDESREQTRRVLAAQREAEARPATDRERLLAVHRNAQRILKSVAVVNPYAPYLTFPDDRLSARRDHRKYLGLIRAVAFAHRFQRKVEGEDLVVGLPDVAIANRLAHEVLGQSIFDLTSPSRRLLVEIREWLDGEERQFSQRELRDRTGWRKTQLAEHVKELVEAEYLVAHTTGPGRRTRYALDWDGRGLDGERFYKGLVDVETLEGLQASGPLPAHVRDTSGSAKPPRKARREPNPAESPSSVRTSGEKQS